MEKPNSSVEKMVVNEIDNSVTEEAEPNVTGRFQCDICNKVIFSTRAVKLHKKHYHTAKEKKFKSGIITKKCKECTGMINILESELKKPNFLFPVLCDICKKTLYGGDQGELEDTADPKSKCPISGFVCIECGCTFTKGIGLENHMKRCHLKPNLIFYCDTCDERYTTLDGLSQHLNTHTKLKFGKVLQCNKCDSLFSGVKKFQKHVNNCHRVDVVNSSANGESVNEDCLLKLTCARTNCNAVFYDEDKFNTHQIVHKYQHYVCLTCQLLFRDSKSLYNHEREEHNASKLSE